MEILGHLAMCVPSVVAHSLFLPHGISMSRALRESERFIERCPHDFSAYSRGTVSVTLSRLKKQGLVAKIGANKKAVWLVTKRGKTHFVSQKQQSMLVLPPKDGQIRLVVFDIPEAERKQRSWLRARLLMYDYAPLQKSVWIGTRPLPRELRQELRERGLTSYVHVVGLEKSSRYRNNKLF